VTVKSEIESSLKIKQRGMRVKKGDQFWRGLSLIVVDAAGATIRFRNLDTGSSWEEPRPIFVSRSLIRVPHGKTKKFNFLKQSFSVLGNKKLSKRQRVGIGRKYVTMAPTMDDARIIRRWMLALAQDSEPKGFKK